MDTNFDDSESTRSNDVAQFANRRLDQLPDLLTVDELAEWLGITKNSLYSLRSQHHDGPQSIRIGKHIRFPQQCVRAWLSDRIESAE